MANELVSKYDWNVFLERYWIKNEKGEKILKVKRGYQLATRHGSLALFIKRKKGLLINIDTASILEEGENIGKVCEYMYECNSNIYSKTKQLLFRDEAIVYKLMDGKIFITYNQKNDKYRLIKAKNGYTILEDFDEMIQLGYDQNTFIIRRGRMISVMELSQNCYNYILFRTEKASLPLAETYRIYDRNRVAVVECYNGNILVEKQFICLPQLSFICCDSETEKYSFFGNFHNVLSVRTGESTYLYSIPLKKWIVQIENSDVYVLNDRFCVLSLQGGSCRIYDDQNGKIIRISGTYTNVDLAEYHDDFILEDERGFKGIANFDGELVLEPCTLQLYELEYGFAYTESKFITCNHITKLK